MKKSGIGTIELFAGAGGLAIGSSRAGISHKAIVEWDHDACETLRENRRKGVAPIADWPEPLEIDVSQFDYGPFEGIELVTGGPPCQPFSMGGKHRANLDRRDMFPQAVRAIREARPRAFIFENVRGLSRATFASYFNYILLQLEFPSITARKAEEWQAHCSRLRQNKTSGGASEYVVASQVLNAANFGVPQTRHRVFIVGLRADLNQEFLFPERGPHSLEALLRDQWVTGEYWDRHEVAKKHRPDLDERTRSRVKTIGLLDVGSIGVPWRTVRDALAFPVPLPDPERNGDGGFQSHRYQPGARSYAGHTGSPLDEPAKALKAGDHGVPGGENMLRRVDGSLRYFTVRESARIQCFPDEYLFHGSWTESMRQLGNAVPVDLAKSVADLVVAKL